MSADLRLGRWEDVLGNVEVDAVICDPPYSERNHVGHNALTDFLGVEGYEREAIAYDFWTPEIIAEFVSHWSPRTRGWMACMTSHDLIPAWEQAYADAGRYHFAPVPCVIRGMTFRRRGDGPSSWSVYLMTARPKTREMAQWGTLPGAYVVGRAVDGSGGGRGKPADLMRLIIDDYSRPGDLVCDPVAGYGSTLAAALQKGRRAIGAEIDPAVHAEALARLSRVQAVDLFAEPKRRQAGLL